MTSQRRQSGTITLDDVAEMLRYVGAADRDTWLRVAMSIKSEFGDAGFDLWDSWSQEADSYDPAAARSVWRSIGPGGVTIGTLVKMANDQGYQRQQTPTPEQAPTPKPRRDTSAYAKQLWMAGSWDDDTVGAHPYAIAKGITWAAGAKRGIASGRVIGKDADCVIVPIRTIETDAIQGVQAINADGKKQTFGTVSGGALILGNTLNLRLKWYCCEGWASAVSMVFHHHHGNAVCACSFGKSNQERAARLIIKKYSPDELTILLERDL